VNVWQPDLTSTLLDDIHCCPDTSAYGATLPGTERHSLGFALRQPSDDHTLREGGACYTVPNMESQSGVDATARAGPSVLRRPSLRLAVSTPATRTTTSSTRLHCTSTAPEIRVTDPDALESPLEIRSQARHGLSNHRRSHSSPGSLVSQQDFEDQPSAPLTLNGELLSPVSRQQSVMDPFNSSQELRRHDWSNVLPVSASIFTPSSTRARSESRNSSSSRGRSRIRSRSANSTGSTTYSFNCDYASCSKRCRSATDLKYEPFAPQCVLVKSR